MRWFSAFALPCAACLDQTYWPKDPTPVVYADGEWLVCSPAATTGDTWPLTVENHHGGDVEVGWVDVACAEVPFATLADGEVLETDTDERTVWYARDAVTRDLLAAFLSTPLVVSDPVVVP